MFLLLLSLACGPKTAPTSAGSSSDQKSTPTGAAYSTDKLLGTWQNDAGGVLTIDDGRHGPMVQSIIDYDGEVFELQTSGWTGTSFGWAYRVPSTSFEVSETVIEATSTALSTTWSNQTGDEGEDHWTRQ